jgi:hypothetical protein
MKRGLAIAAVLGVVLLVAVALATEWLWYCPQCSYVGTAYYSCPNHCGVISYDAYGTDERVGPPDRLCWYCLEQYQDSVWCHADSAVCHNTPPHRYYAPDWTGY